MEAQILSSTLGAMGPVLAKLHQLYSSDSEYHLPKSLPSGYQIKDLKTIVEDIHKFLVRHSSLEAPRAMAKLWMNEVRELSFDMEDFIDRTAQRPFEVEEFKNLIDQARDACTRFHRYVDGRDNDMPQPSIPHDSSFGNTERSDEIEECSSSMVNGQGHVPRFIGEATYLDGMPDFRKNLISRLRDGDDAEKGKKVISIHGPAGVGKTALAKELYREIGREFKYRVFVRASQTPDTRRLLGSMISQVQRHERLPYACSVQDLIGNLRGHLQHNRYFIVIDGLWETRSWDIVSKAFPEGSHCSRILVTTDIKEVALECCGYESDGIFEMEPLQIDHSKHLFFKRVFGSSEQECPQHLSKISQEIISSCDGLPLAVILISGILACEQENLKLWNRVKDCLFSSIKKNQSQQDFLREIVLLCYNNLSCHLRTCLLYLNLYPEGYAFLKADLVKQWNAEGFTSAAEKNGTNQKAEDYFHELVCRGLIQPYHFKFSDEVMFYTVHSIVFEFIRNKSIEENFTTVIDYSNTITQLSAKARRLSLTFSNSKYAKKPEGITLTQVRSLNFYGFVECLPSLTKFEALRVLVLDLWGSLKELDLSFIDTLFQLRYIHITTNTDVKLPAKMRGLQNLETLEIYATVASVPSDIVYLSSLLHLCLHGEINLSDGTGYMKSLRTLQYFDLSSNSEDNIRGLGQMRDLQDLHLTCSTEMPGLLERKLIALASSLGNNYQLKSLVLAPGASCTSIFVDCSSRVCSLPVLLQRLELLPPICIFPRLPSWIGQSEKLCILKIVVRELTWDDTKRITGLKKLTILSLYVRKPIAESIIFSRTEFPALKHFKLRCGILRLDFQKETMPNLQSLSLTFNAHTGEKYGDMIAGIENLLNLQEIVVRVGTAPGAEESDRMAAESFCKDTIRKQSKAPNFSVRRANSVEEEIVQFRSPAASSSRSDFMLNRAIICDVIRDVNEIELFGDNELRVISDGALETGKAHVAIPMIIKRGVVTSTFPHLTTREASEQSRSCDQSIKRTAEPEGFMPNPIVSDVIREANEIVMDHDNEPRVVTSDRVLQTSKRLHDSEHWHHQSLAATTGKYMRTATGETKADLAVSLAKSAVERAVTKALSVSDEAMLRKSTQNDLVFIAAEFQMMQSFLDVADEERVSNSVVRTWVRQVRELAHNVEDSIEYVIHLNKTPDWYCRRLPVFVRPALSLNKAVADIKQLKSRVEEVSLRIMRYNLISDSGCKPVVQQQMLSGGASMVAATYDMVFQARDTTKMKRAGFGDLTKLLDTKKPGDDLGVISLWAASGNLDTTLIIREAYGQPEICEKFGCRGWAKLTHPFNPQEFQRSLLMQFHTNSCHQHKTGGDLNILQRARSQKKDILQRLETAAQGDLVQEFVDKMEKQRYLVVLENISSMMEWDTVRAYLPDGKSGSWIIVSSQQPQVARLCVGDPCHALELKQHSVEHSVCIFFREVFQGGVGDNGTSQVDKDSHNNGYAFYAKIPTSKANANMWIHRFPLVGVRKTQMDDLRSYLTKACVNGFPVVSVWGIAGVGKSALVRNLYYSIMHDKSNKTFPKLSWVDVSHPFNLTNIAWGLLSEFESNPPQQDGTTNSPQPANGTNHSNQDAINYPPQQDGTDHSHQRDRTKNSPQQDRISNLIHVCRQFMDQDRCLVVVDGLQTTEEWDLIRYSLVSKCSKSIIIVITTDATVAMHCASREEAMYNVKSLEDQEAYDLFSMEVGKLSEMSPLKDCKDQELRTLISKCGGLPKVIVAIANFLAPMTVSWMNSAVNMSNTFMHDLKTKAEFDDLRGLFGWMDSYFRNCPDYLKPCIVYLSIFPQGQSIRRRRLVRRWIAEGYCRDTYDRSVEENGEKFFSMLLDLSIIQQTPDSVITTTDTRMILCQVNNFFREYIISRQKDEDLVFELDGRCILNTQRTGRHLVLKESWDRDKIVFDSIDFSRLRSLTVFGKWRPFFISKNMAVLRVLDLENATDVTYEYLEKMLRLLPRLKFLSLRGLKDICHLPSSFVVLKQLQTLDVRGTSIVTLPPSITKLSKLQYIRAGTTVKELLPIPCAHLSWLPVPRRACPVGGVEVPPGMEKLTALHTLGVVNVTLSGGVPLLKELKKLTQLHKLAVTGVSQKNSKEFWSAISEHVHLESLSVWLSTGSEHCLDGMSLPQQRAAEDKAKKKTQHKDKAQQMDQERHLENLRSLKLYGLAGDVPLWIKHLPKLKKLDLDMTMSGKADISKVLGEMAELLILRLRVNLRHGAHITSSQGGDKYVELGFHAMMNGVQMRCYLNVKIFEIALKSDLNVTLKVSFGSEAMQSLELLTACCSNESAKLKFCDLKNLSENKLKEVRYLGSLDDTLKEDMENQLRKHPRKPSLKLE